MALGLALLVNVRIKGVNLFRTVYFVPVVTSIVVISVLWQFMYQPDGLINSLLAMVVQSEELRPVMLGIDYFKQLNTSWGQIMAYSSLITIPVLVLFVSFQRAFINSIASSGVKG